MIEVSRLAKAFGDRALFEKVSLRLNPGSRYGLVGANGSGKTTFMNILAGTESTSEGTVNIPRAVRLGVLDQDSQLDESALISHLAMMGDQRAWQALSRQQQLLAQSEADGQAIAEVEDHIRATDGYTLESRAGAILEGLGMPTELHQRPLSTLSGGFKLRVHLAQVLLSGPDALLLDEPTNHLDILSIRWLEKFLAQHDGCVVVISHDQRFLDNVTTHILDVDYDTISLYTGNYTAFELEKATTRERKEAEAERMQKAVAEKKAFVERFRYKATKARQAQSRLKQIEKVQKQLASEQLPTSSRRSPAFRFEQQRKSGRDVLAIDDLCKSYDGETEVLHHITLPISRGEKVAIIGQNGIGKSTLLKILVGDLEPSSGSVTWGYETAVGYFPQDHSELLADPNLSALDYLWNSCAQETTSFVRGQLGRLLFSGKDVDKKLRALSGGESARLIFSRLIVKQPNVLVLDEPTNHLDIESIHTLVEALQQYEGTLLFVSHNRWFVSQLASRIVELTPAGPNDFPGSYQDYLAHCGDDHLDADAVLKASKQRGAKSRADDQPSQLQSEWHKQKQRRSEHRKLLSRRDEVTGEIDQAERRLEEIRQLYCQPGFFEDTPKDELSALEQEEAALGPQIEALMAEWEQVEADLEESGEVEA